MNTGSWFSRGKLLITGEYLVMQGAQALALPLRHGQNLSVTSTARNVLSWVSKEMGTPWFRAEFGLPGLTIMTEKNEVSLRLQRLLRQAAIMNPGILDGDEGAEVITDTTFRMKWGFGSSSTLVSGIAYWFNIDPYELYRTEFSGSGYDLACARSDRPVLYRLYNATPWYETTRFEPSFSDKLYFIYLGKKQDTEKSIGNFREKARYSLSDLERVSMISQRMADVDIGIDEFESLMREHEKIMAGVLDEKPVKETLFTDYHGEVKSLGSWGGDFVMATWKHGLAELERYLSTKGLDTVFRLNDIKA